MRFLVNFLPIAFAGHYSFIEKCQTIDECPLLQGHSYQNYLELDEIYNVLNHWAEAFPEFLKRKVYGYSAENRELVYYTLTDSRSRSKKSEIEIDSLLHPREQLSSTAALYYILTTLELAARTPPDLEAFYTLRKRVIYYIPVFNPDGLVANHKQFEKMKKEGKLDTPNWEPVIRKNRKKTNTTGECTFKNPGETKAKQISLEMADDQFGFGQGVNLNFNFDTKNYKGSRDASICDPNYAGEHPFSEPETQAFKKFIEEHPKIKLAYSLHGVGDFLITPVSILGNNNIKKKDLDIIQEIGEKGKFLKGYTKKNIGRTGHGTLNVWLYEEQNILSFSAEVGYQPTKEELSAGAKFFYQSKKNAEDTMKREFSRLRYVVRKVGCELFPTRRPNGNILINNKGLDNCPAPAISVIVKDMPLPLIFIAPYSIQSRQTYDTGSNIKDARVCVKEKDHTNICICDFTEEIGSGTFVHADKDKDCEQLTDFVKQTERKKKREREEL